MSSYFVAGASRGIGHELVLQLSDLADTSVVFAGVRNPKSSLSELRSKSNVHIIKLDVTSDEDAASAARFIEEVHGALDVLIINAGAANNKLPTQASVKELEESLELNTISTHRLVLATLPLIKAGRDKRIIAIGTGSGSFTLAQPFAKDNLPVGFYGVSKAALHFLIMLYGAELSTQGILTASIHPGLVETDGAKGVLDKAEADTEAKWAKSGVVMITRSESAEGIISVTKNLKPSESGNLFAWNGTKLPF